MSDLLGLVAEDLDRLALFEGDNGLLPLTRIAGDVAHALLLGFTLMVLTDSTFTEKSSSMASLIWYLFAPRATSNVYLFCSIRSYERSDTMGRMMMLWASI